VYSKLSGVASACDVAGWCRGFGLRVADGVCLFWHQVAVSHGRTVVAVPAPIHSRVKIPWTLGTPCHCFQLLLP
jgi:hypothetical protein